MRAPVRAVAAPSAGRRSRCAGRAAAHPVLQLQRQAGNRAATQWVQRACACGSCCGGAAEDEMVGPPASPAVQRSVARTAKPPPTSPAGPVVVQRETGTAEVAIMLLQGMQRGISLHPEGFNGKYESTAAMVQQSLLRSLKAILYWNRNGCVHLGDDGPELVRPCPPIAIAGWVPNLFPQLSAFPTGGVETLAPKVSGFLPVPPGGVGLPAVPAPTTKDPPGQSPKSPEGPPKLRAQIRDTRLRSDQALEVATFMITNRLEGQHMIARGLMDATSHRIAMSVQTHLLDNAWAFEQLCTLGVAKTESGGSGSRWVRPAPAGVIAMLLGIGPVDNPALKGWDGH